MYSTKICWWFFTQQVEIVMSISLSEDMECLFIFMSFLISVLLSHLWSSLLFIYGSLFLTWRAGGWIVEVGKLKFEILSSHSNLLFLYQNIILYKFDQPFLFFHNIFMIVTHPSHLCKSEREEGKREEERGCYSLTMLQKCKWVCLHFLHQWTLWKNRPNNTVALWASFCSKSNLFSYSSHMYNSNSIT